MLKDLLFGPQRCRLRVIGVTRDRRDKAQLEAARALEQARLDATLQERWELRVRDNVERREAARQRNYVPELRRILGEELRKALAS
jgi:hypothetical protein